MWEGLVVHTHGGACTRWWPHKVVHTQDKAHTRRSMATARVLLFKGVARAGPRIKRSKPSFKQSSQGAQCVWEGLAQGSAYTRRCTHKAVHTQGGAHPRWSAATARVLLFQGVARVSPRVERSEPSVERSEPSVARSKPRCTMCVGRVSSAHTHTRRCIHKAGHTQCGLRPPQKSCYARGVRGLAPASSEATRFSSEASRLSSGRTKVHRVCGKGSRCTHTRKCIDKAVHTQGRAHTRWFVATARVVLCKGGVRVDPRFKRTGSFVERTYPVFERSS